MFLFLKPIHSRVGAENLPLKYLSQPLSPLLVIEYFAFYGMNFSEHIVSYPPLTFVWQVLVPNACEELGSGRMCALLEVTRPGSVSRQGISSYQNPGFLIPLLYSLIYIPIKFLFTETTNSSITLREKFKSSAIYVEKFLDYWIPTEPLCPASDFQN